MQDGVISASVEGMMFPTSRGALLLVGGQAVALIAGFAVQVGLTRILLPEFYGLYAVAISVISWLEIFLASIIAVPIVKTVSEGSLPAIALWRWVWRNYLPLCIAVWLLFSISSWGIASLLQDERLVLLFLVAALELPFYGVYFATYSLLQGLRAFGWQALVMAIYAIVRVIFILLFVILTRSVLGAFMGNALTAALMMFVAMAILRPFLKKGSAETAPFQSETSLSSLFVGIGLPVLLVTLLDQILLAMDLWLLKRMSQPEFAGFYGAARFFAFVPLMLSVGLNNAWFPAMCHELGKGKRERAKALLREAMRVLVLGLFPFAVIVWSTAKPLSVLLFSISFEPTSEPMRWLVVATSLFTFMAFMRGALIADNEFRLPVILAVVMTALDFWLCYRLIPRYGMLGAAWATTATSAVGLIAMWVLTSLRFGDFVPISTLVRVIIASFVLWLILVFWTVTGFMLLVQYMLLSAIYILLLVLLGELKASDWQILKVAMGSIMTDAISVFRKQ